MRMLNILLIAILSLAVSGHDYSCPFAASHASLDFSSTENQALLINEYCYWEAQFLKELGVDPQTGLALNGWQLHFKSGQPEGDWASSASLGTEAIHVALLAKVLEGDEIAANFYDQQQALILLYEKMRTLEQHLPRLISEGEVKVNHITLSAKGGEKLFWAVYALNEVLRDSVPQYDSFVKRWMDLEKVLEDTMLNQATQSDLIWDYLVLPFLNEDDLLENLRQKEYKKFESFKNIIMSGEAIHEQEIRKLVAEASLEEIFNPRQVSGLYLTDKKGASIWLNYILSRRGGQSKYGSVAEEDCNKDTQLCALSFESKITPVLAMMGGIHKIISRRVMREANPFESQQGQKFRRSSVLNTAQESQISLSLPEGLAPEFRQEFISCRVNTFKDFIWGAATASYQIEGAFDEDGKGMNIWDDFVRIDGRINNDDTGDVADDFYHKYEDDIQLMTDLGLPYFRMSLSWARLLPDGTTDNINWAGVAFYNDVIDKLLARGIQPFVTLYHWDLPSALMRDKSVDGWLNPAIQDIFNDYADFCFGVFGDRVKHWITFNEPQTFTWLGYGTGYHAPGRCSDYMSADCAWVADGGDSGSEPYLTAHNVLLAHAKAVRTYREKYQKEQGGVIGICINSDYAYPWDASNADDIAAVDTVVQFGFGWYNDPIVFGRYPDKMVEYITDNRLPTFTEEESELMKGSFDFLGLNHYSSKYVHHTGEVGKDYSSDGRYWINAYNSEGELIGPFGESTWLNVVPNGIRDLLNWIDKRYDHQPVFIFENGCSAPGENDLPIEEAIHDDFRVNFYQEYIKNVQLALEEDGANVVGYFAWSILDNFEWADGYSVRFGMVYVDYEDNQKRYPKDSAYWYSNWIKEHSQ